MFGFGFLADRANFDIPFHLIAWVDRRHLRPSAAGQPAQHPAGFGDGHRGGDAARPHGRHHAALGQLADAQHRARLHRVRAQHAAARADHLLVFRRPADAAAAAGSIVDSGRLAAQYPRPLCARRGAWGRAASFSPGSPSSSSSRRPSSGACGSARIALGAKALVLPLVAVGLLLAGIERIEFPTLSGFNITGGMQVPPELVALWAGLSIYSSAFIAEIVRSAIEAVPKGQHEAALRWGFAAPLCCS